MSNIYIQEPSTKGKVLLTTSVGDIDIELWSKEAPKACRNFVQLCMEGYYNGTIFHRVVRDFIVQGGDPTGTGTGGESIYGAPFKDEFHSRLRFVRRGLVAMANAGPHDNGSQFFFTMRETPELMNKHTIFGKVVGDTLYNMLKLNEVQTDAEDRPLYPPKIIKVEILSNPFDDIVPRILKKPKKEKEDDKKVKSKSKATKNFSLLSFGEEAEEDEEQTFKASKKFSGKSKSSHDLTDDPHLSSVAIVDAENELGKRKQDDTEADTTSDEVRKKLKKDIDEPKVKAEEPVIMDEKTEKKNRSEEIKKEAKRIKQEIKAARKREKEEAKAAKMAKEKPVEAEVKEEKKESESSSDFLEAFRQERQKYKSLKKQQGKKGQSRENQTLALLEKFRSKLSEIKQLSTGHSDSEGEEEKKQEASVGKADEGVEEEEDVNDLSWMKHKLHFEDDKKRKVLDANVQDSDRYEIFDPRNPLTKRRREASKKKSKEKKGN